MSSSKVSHRCKNISLFKSSRSSIAVRCRELHTWGVIILHRNQSQAVGVNCQTIVLRWDIYINVDDVRSSREGISLRNCRWQATIVTWVTSEKYDREPSLLPDRLLILPVSDLSGDCFLSNSLSLRSPSDPDVPLLEEPPPQKKPPAPSIVTSNKFRNANLARQCIARITDFPFVSYLLAANLTTPQRRLQRLLESLHLSKYQWVTLCCSVSPFLRHVECGERRLLWVVESWSCGNGLLLNYRQKLFLGIFTGLIPSEARCLFKFPTVHQICRWLR